MPIRGGGSPAAISDCSSTAHPVSAAGSEPTTITSSPSVLITRASSGRRLFDRLDEPLDRADRLLVAPLDGQARVAGEVGEGDRHAQAPLLGGARLVEVGLHVADHVLLDEVREEAAVQVVHERRRERQHLAREALHLLGDLDAGHALAHQRLVHVEVEQAHLGVGDLGDRLPVHAQQLQEGAQREARPRASRRRTS